MTKLIEGSFEIEEIYNSFLIIMKLLYIFIKNSCSKIELAGTSGKSEPQMFLKFEAFKKFTASLTRGGAKPVYL